MSVRRPHRTSVVAVMYRRREKERCRETPLHAVPSRSHGGCPFRNADPRNLGERKLTLLFGGEEERPFISDLKLNSPEPARMESGWGDSKFVKDANLCQIVPLSAPPLFLVRKRGRAAAKRPLTDSFLIPLLPRRLFGLVFFRQGHGDGEWGKFPNPIAYSFSLSLSLSKKRKRRKWK